MMPGLALASRDGPMETTLQSHWTILPEESASALEEPTPRTSVEGTPRLPEETQPQQFLIDREQTEQTYVEPTSMVAKLALNFQRMPLANRRRLKSLRKGTSEVEKAVDP
eukprot:CAMPEP_0172911468 /NCGR_PEP_ID=MMETSP1075-20121228/186587_1 /TAXON_ID=2916 /ORGANISM="Ceratium fusus, Strain PA161109" /LENGTH=109 /DNA_ID=CAMNT_0013769789 /DNA_START=118 /DNA_END=443 /DNA_ORIENTATION=-